MAIQPGSPAPPVNRRLAAWYITGPFGHLAGGTLDVLELLARGLWRRARGRPKPF